MTEKKFFLIVILFQFLLIIISIIEIANNNIFFGFSMLTINIIGITFNFLNFKNSKN